MTGPPVVTVEVAFPSAPSSTAPVWTNITSKVLQSEGITRSYGRGDQFSEVQPGTLSLTLDNTDGRFTAGLTTGLYYPNVKPGKRIRVSYVFAGVTYRRFDGYVNGWPTVWPGGGQSYSQVRITATDASRRLNRGRKLRSVLSEEVLYDGPVAYWPLGEPEGSITAADVSGPATNMTVAQAGGGGTLTFGSGTGPPRDSASAVQTAPVNADNGKFLRAGTITSAITGGVCSIECWFVAPTGVADGSAVMAGIFGDRRSYIQLYFNGSGQVVARGLGMNGSDVSATVTSSGVFANGLTHHAVAVCTITATQVAVTLYVDGALRGTATGAGTGIPVPTVFADVGVGAYPARSGFAAGGLFAGTFAHAAVYGKALTAAQAFAHYQAGATGFAGEKTDVRIRRLARYAAIPDPASGAVANPGFEVDTAGWTVSGGVAIARDTAVADTGVASGKLTWATGALNTQTAYITATGLTVGRTYRQKVRVRSDAGQPRFLLQVQCSPTITGTTTNVADGAFHDLELTFTAGATSGLIVLYNNDAATAGQVGWIDTITPPLPEFGLHLDAGASALAGQDTTGQAAMTAMMEATRAEDGLLFFDGAGALVMQSRIRRFNQASSFTLTAGTLQEIGVDTMLTTDDTQQVNDATYTREGGTAQRVVNQASIDADGTYGDPLTLLLSTDNEVLDRANWAVQTRSTPAPRCPAITVDLLTQPTATLIAAVLGAELSDRFTVAALPSQAPASSVDLIVEGETERLSDSEWSITWNASQASALSNIWQMDSYTTEPWTFAY